jgi:hypothetical protein
MSSVFLLTALEWEGMGLCAFLRIEGGEITDRIHFEIFWRCSNAVNYSQDKQTNVFFVGGHGA